MNTNKNKDQGFTLVELLIVIVILGILATVTVFAVRGITDQGQKSACSADKKTLQVSVEAYIAQYGGTTIPDTTAGTLPTGATWALGATPAGTLVNAGLLVEAPAATNWVVASNGTLTAGAKCV